MDERDIVHISKFLSLVLRHRPEVVGMKLEEGGWLRVDELIAGAKEAGVSLNREVLRVVVEHSDRKRFSFSEDGQKVRANYGHSIPIDLDLEPIEPPEFLFHGSAVQFIDAIRREGLVPQGRQYVHLSPDEQTAAEVGQRHGEAVVCTIQARLMHESGFRFYRTVSGLWLTEHVPSEYIEFQSRYPASQGNPPKNPLD